MAQPLPKRGPAHETVEPSMTTETNNRSRLRPQGRRGLSRQTSFRAEPPSEQPRGAQRMRNDAYSPSNWMLLG